MRYTQVAPDAFEKLQLNAGILVDDFEPETGEIGNILAATTGGLTFNSNPTYTDFGADVDNVPANTWQLKRVTAYDPSISGTAITVTPALAKMLSGAGVVDDMHIIPTGELKESDFDDVWIVSDYSDKNNGKTEAGFIAIHIMNALNTNGFRMQTSKDAKGNFAFEFHGHYDLDDVQTVPYEIYVKAGETPVLAALSVTSAAGASAGKSKITVSGYTLGTGESFVYKTAITNAPTVAYGDIVASWTEIDSGDDITPTAQHTKITVAVKGAGNAAIGSGSATLVINS